MRIHLDIAGRTIPAHAVSTGLRWEPLQDGGDDTARQFTFVRLSKRAMDRLRAQGASSWAMVAIYALINNGTLEELGCHCGHCRRDWDCCGRMYPAHHTVRRARRGFVVETTYYRNI